MMLAVGNRRLALTISTIHLGNLHVSVPASESRNVDGPICKTDPKRMYVSRGRNQ